MSAEKKPDKTADQHKSRFMVRLPPEFQAIFAEARRRFRRTNVEEVRIALEKHFGEMGLWPPLHPGIKAHFEKKGVLPPDEPPKE